MNNKRSHIDIDPDYEDVTDHQVKRQRVLENDAKEATVKKIESITRGQFEAEIRQKEAEINTVDQRLNQARLLMDRLRACIVASQYSSTIPGMRDRSQPPSIHPTVKKRLGKAPVTVTTKTSEGSHECSDDKPVPRPMLNTNLSDVPQRKPQPIPASSILSPDKMADTRGARFKIKQKIIVGNVSKFIPLERREVNDQSTHKWMVYVRGPKDKPHIDSFVKKVWFFLHPSYKPNDLVEIDKMPFHLTRRGWGEFPVRVQLHFRDQRNKRVDIIHNLKLDKTCTGLQTLGAETVIEVELERDKPRSESPLPLLDADSKHGHHALNKGHNSCTVETTTSECVTNHFSNSENVRTTTLMEIQEVPVDTLKADPLTDSKSAVSENTKLSNGDEVSQPNGTTSIDTVSKVEDSAARVIHLKTKEDVPSEVCKNSNVAINHSKTGSGSTSSENPISKQPGLMYMRCKDQQGNLLLLPYKLGPGKTAADSNSEINRDVCSSNKAAASSATNSSTSTSVLQTVPTTLPQIPGASRPPSTNLVLKVTPTGLKLVPAESETPANLSTPSNSLLQNNTQPKPKLKSLLANSQGSVVSSSALSAGNVAKQVGVPGASTTTPLSQITSNTGVFSKQVSSNLKLNNSVDCAKTQMSKPLVSGQSLVLANIGDKPYLFKVVQKPDNQVLLVPNKQTSMPVSKMSCTNVTRAPVSSTTQQQKSLLSVSSSSAASPAQADAKSLTLSFGLSPFSIQSSNKKSLLSTAVTQKAAVTDTSERKIHVWKKKIKDMFEIREEVKPLKLEDYQDLLSVVRAAVRRHPVVKEIVDRSVHPYCAKSNEEWLSWNIGKRRSSEWQRAASVRKFIEGHVKEGCFKGEQLWTTRQIMSWCRLHAFSPHHLETTSLNSVSDMNSLVTPVRPLSSLTNHQHLQDRLDTLLNDLPASDESDQDVDIIGVESAKVKLKEEPVEGAVSDDDCEVLPPSDEAIFVQDVAQKIGVKFNPVKVEADVRGSVTEDIIYTVMSRLAEDIFREAFSFTRQSTTSPEDELRAEHVFKAVSSLTITDFLCNHNLGIHDNTAQSGVR